MGQQKNLTRPSFCPTPLWSKGGHREVVPASRAFRWNFSTRFLCLEEQGIERWGGMVVFGQPTALWTGMGNGGQESHKVISDPQQTVLVVRRVGCQRRKSRSKRAAGRAEDERSGGILLGVASLDMTRWPSLRRLALQLNNSTAGSSHDVHGALGCFVIPGGGPLRHRFSDSLDADGWA